MIMDNQQKLGKLCCKHGIGSSFKAISIFAKR